jgi:hypothetical protein
MKFQEKGRGVIKRVRDKGERERSKGHGRAVS